MVASGTIGEPLVIEFDDGANRNIYFAPLDRAFRGRYDAQIACRRDKDAGALLSELPEPIPGQRIAIDPTGKAAVIEPLHDPRHSAIAERVKSRGLRLCPEREPVHCDAPTLLHWIKEAVQSGQAKIVSGQLPATIEGQPRMHFIVQPRESSEATLAKALDNMAAAQREQTAALTALVSALVPAAKASGPKQ